MTRHTREYTVIVTTRKAHPSIVNLVDKVTRWLITSCEDLRLSYDLPVGPEEKEPESEQLRYEPTYQFDVSKYIVKDGDRKPRPRPIYTPPEPRYIDEELIIRRRRRYGPYDD